MAKLVIGIAGGMGAGKSTLAARLKARLGAAIVSVDEERRLLAGSDKDGFWALWENARDATRERVAARIASEPGIVLLEWARLAEDGFADLTDGVLVVDCPQDERLRRLDGGDLTRAQILARMAKQAPAGDTLAALAAQGVPTQLIDASGPVPGQALFDAYDELAGSEFSSSSSFCLFRIPRKGGRVIWEVTNSCNYGCRYCIFSSTPRKPEGELDTARMLGVVDELAAAGFTHIKFTGGEPMLRPDLLEILAHARSRGFKSDLSTNAAFIDEAAALSLARLGLEMVHVSLDGHTQAIQESARGSRTYAPTVAGIKALVAQGIRPRVGCVVFKGNQDHLAEIAGFCHGLGCDEVIFSLMEPAGRMKGQTRLLCDLPHIDLASRLEAVRLAMLGMIKVVANLPQPVGSGCGSCPGGERFLFINHKGMVSPCTWVSDLSPGFDSAKTLREASLSDLLGASENIRFRRTATALAASGLDRCPMKIAPAFAHADLVQSLFEQNPQGLDEATEAGDAAEAAADSPLALRLSQGGRFSAVSPMYAFSNENVAGWIGAMDLRGKDVLTVGGSGDQMICAYAAGAASVSNLDINALASHMAELKLAMLARLARARFQDFFGALHFPIYQSARDALSLSARHFFDQAYKRFGNDGARLAASPLLRSRQGMQRLERNLPYLRDDASYQLARAACEGKPFAWATRSAAEEASLPAPQAPCLDAIILSNLADYASADSAQGHGTGLESFVQGVAIPIASRLRPGGRMLVAYAYGAVDPSAPPRSAIDDPAQRQALLGSRPGLRLAEASLPSAWGGHAPDTAIFWDKT